MKRGALLVLFLIAAASATAGASTIYEVDEDRDGRADWLLILEQSDSLA